MKQTYSLKQKLIQMLHILLPIFVTQVAMQLMTFFDTVMSGNYRTSDLAGVAIATSIWVPVYTGISGIFLAVTPIVAQHMGAERKQLIAPSVTQAAYLAVIFGAAVIGIGIKEGWNDSESDCSQIFSCHPVNIRIQLHKG